jgi:hypothetical protein
MTPRQVLLGAALALAAGLAVFGDKTPQAGLAEPVTRAAKTERPAPVASSTMQQEREPTILRLIPREALVGDGVDEFKTADHAFARQDWTPSPPVPPAPPPPPPPPPPSAPVLPFTYIGKSISDGEWEVYLARGDRTYLVRDKSVIDSTYRVDAIAPPTLILTYLPLNQIQQLNIGVFD